MRHNHDTKRLLVFRVDPGAIRAPAAGFIPALPPGGDRPRRGGPKGRGLRRGAGRVRPVCPGPYRGKNVRQHSIHLPFHREAIGLGEQSADGFFAFFRDEGAFQHAPRRGSGLVVAFLAAAGFPGFRSQPHHGCIQVFPQRPQGHGLVQWAHALGIVDPDMPQQPAHVGVADKAKQDTCVVSKTGIFR